MAGAEQMDHATMEDGGGEEVGDLGDRFGLGGNDVGQFAAAFEVGGAG